MDTLGSGAARPGADGAERSVRSGERSARVSGTSMSLNLYGVSPRLLQGLRVRAVIGRGGTGGAPARGWRRLVLKAEGVLPAVGHV